MSEFVLGCRGLSKTFVQGSYRVPVLTEVNLSVKNAETVAIAVKYEAQHSERIAVLERKLEAQEAEASLADRDLAEMMTQLKSANAGVGAGMPTGATGPTDADLGLPGDGAALRSEIDALSRQRQRAAADAAADEKLAELKRKMGQ